MKFHDNLMIPVIAANSDGEITYKNKAAKRCIPSPRTKANILNHINKKNLRFRRDMGDTRVEHIKNDKSIFNRALVICDTEAADEIWFFSPELQLFEPEDITTSHIEAMSRWLRENLNLILNHAPTAADNLFNRYQRAGEELLRAMKYLDIEALSQFFKLTDVLTSLKDKTQELAGSLNIRVAFSVGISDPYGGYELRFRPFASAYVQLLNLIIRISRRPECSVEAIQIKDNLDLVFRSKLTVPEDFPSEGDDLSALVKLFPHETANILFIEQSMNNISYKIYYTIDADGLLTFHLYVPLNDKRGYPISMPKPEIVVQTAFRHAEKRAHEYLESIFMLY